jgi:hypothetical protein
MQFLATSSLGLGFLVNPSYELVLSGRENNGKHINYLSFNELGHLLSTRNQQLMSLMFNVHKFRNFIMEVKANGIYTIFFIKAKKIKSNFPI